MLRGGAGRGITGVAWSLGHEFDMYWVGGAGKKNCGDAGIFRAAMSGPGNDAAAGGR